MGEFASAFSWYLPYPLICESICGKLQEMKELGCLLLPPLSEYNGAIKDSPCLLPLLIRT